MVTGDKFLSLGVSVFRATSSFSRTFRMKKLTVFRKNGNGYFRNDDHHVSTS